MGSTSGIQFEGGASRSIGDRFSDAPYGFKILQNASGSHIADGTSEHCWVANIIADAGDLHISNTRILVATTHTNRPGVSNYGVTNIVGLFLKPNALGTTVTDCDLQVDAYDWDEETGLSASTGVIVAAHQIIIDNLKIRGNENISGEIGIRVIPDNFGGKFYIDASGGGFEDTGDRVVKFDTPGMGQSHCIGQEWYIVHDPGEEPVEISTGWGSSLKIFIRASTAANWTQLTTGQAYP